MKSSLPIVLFVILASFLKAEVARFSLVKTDSLTIKSEDGTATLRVTVERFDRDKLNTRETGEEISIWHGDRQLPFEVMLTPTMITGFDLTIDGKTIEVPRNFWNDIGGLPLQKLVIDSARPVKTQEDEFAREKFLEQNERSFPRLSRTPQGSTILVTWIRPEE